MVIKGYLRTSLLEWPGKISAVVFVAGCNFRCPFCHNKDLVLSPQKLPTIPEEEVLTDLKRRKRWIDGVVITGGEATLAADLVGFMGRVKDLGFLTMIETNGTKPEVLERIFREKLIDRLSLDVKTELEPKAYIRAAGVEVDLEAIKRSIAMVFNSPAARRISVASRGSEPPPRRRRGSTAPNEESPSLHAGGGFNSGLEFELRTTVVPTLHTRESLLTLAKQLSEINHLPFPPKAGPPLAETINHSPYWFLQQFQPQNCLDPAFEKIHPYKLKVLEEILVAVKDHYPQTELRGNTSEV